VPMTTGSADPAGAVPPVAPDDVDPGLTLRFDDDGEVTAVPVSAPLESALELGGVLGQGGMAVVREARQRVLERAVAVKSARSPNGTVDAMAAGRLVAEARITGALEHPGILPVHDILTDAGGLPHIVLKRVEGRSWGDVMDDAELLTAEFGASDVLSWNLGVLDAVCNAVHFAHSQGVVHRDLKPENVMVGSFGQVYVLDWGIAVSLRDDDRFPRAVDQRRLVGTPRYMAPEMVGGDGRLVTVQTDVYLLGALLYRIVAGRPPHKGFGLKKILAGIEGFRPELPDAPAELVALIADAMHLDPAARPVSAEVFRRRMNAFLAHRGATELAERTALRLDELLAVLTDADADRVRVYDLFGTVRFGFQESLSAWPGNPVARDGLRRAAAAMAVWELDQGDDRAAEVLLAALDEVPTELSSRLDAVRDARLTSLDRLERLARDRDPRIGQGLRVGLAAVFTVTWGLVPLLPAGSTLWGSLAQPFVWGAIALVALGLFRQEWMATRTNRSVLLLLGAALYAQALLKVGMLTGTSSLREVYAGVYIINAGFCVLAAVILHRGFWAPWLWFSFAYLTFDAMEPWRPWMASVGNLLMGGSSVWMWWPRARDPGRASVDGS
jgi:tRNA A-37 threonylcarbamoyl transferase component Bud32